MYTEDKFFLWDKQSNLGHVGIKMVTRILKDGIVVSEKFARASCVAPGYDLNKLAEVLSAFADPTELISVIKAVHTPEVIAAYATFMENQRIP